MTSLRPECKDSTKTALPDDAALILIAKSVAKRRGLIRGKLHDGLGHHCAIGCFWEDNPGVTLHSKLIDEVAAVNDSLAHASPKERWKFVQSWLRLRLRKLGVRP